MFRKKKPRNRAGPVRYGLTWAPPGGSAHTEMLSRASSLVYACSPSGTGGNGTPAKAQTHSTKARTPSSFSHTSE